MNEINKKANISIEWKSSQEVLEEARVLFKNKFPGGAVSRSYYAIFHAVSALLLTEGLEARSHQSLGRLFSLHFVKAKKFEPKYSRILSTAQKYREEADYFSEYVFSLEDAEEFIKTIENFLKNSGYLK